MADEADRAEATEQMQRDAALRNHSARLRVIPLCENCEETPCHVTASGLTWRFCADCGAEHLRRSAGV